MYPASTIHILVEEIKKVESPEQFTFSIPKFKIVAKRADNMDDKIPLPAL